MQPCGRSPAVQSLISRAILLADMVLVCGAIVTVVLCSSIRCRCGCGDASDVGEGKGRVHLASRRPSPSTTTLPCRGHHPSSQLHYRWNHQMPATRTKSSTSLPPK